MAFTKITQSDVLDKGVIGLPDTPNLSTQGMQEKFDELALDVLMPKHNALIDELEASTAAASIGVVATTHTTGDNLQAVLDSIDTSAYGYVDNKIGDLKGYVDEQDTTLSGRITDVNTLATNAYNTANAASETATEAKNTANNAYTLSYTANQTANNAYSKAESAESAVTVAVQSLTNYINQQLTVIDPVTGIAGTVQQALNDLFNYMRPSPLTAKEYDDLGLTAKGYDDYGLTAYQYDMYAKELLV